MVYFNNAADSFPKLGAITDFLSKPEYIVTGRECSCQKNKMLSITEAFRNNLKDFLHIPDNYLVTITNGATEAANLVINSFYKNRLNNDDYVIYDYANHNSVIRPLFELYGKENLRLHKNRFQSPDFFDKIKCSELINDPDKCQLIIFNYQSNVSGSILNNTKEIIQYIVNNNLKNTSLILDITQAVGNTIIDIESLIKDTNFERLYLFGTLHKSMRSISGCGFLIHPLNNNLKPLIYGGTGTVSLDFHQPKDFPHYLESGTYNIPAIACANISIKYMESFINESQIRKSELVNYFVKKYRENENETSKKYFTLQNKWITPSSGIINILPNNDLIGEYAATSLFNNGFVTRFGCHCCPMFHFKVNDKQINQTLRISFNAMNTNTEIDNFIDTFFNATIFDVVLRTN